MEVNCKGPIRSFACSVASGRPEWFSGFGGFVGFRVGLQVLAFKAIAYALRA